MMKKMMMKAALCISFTLVLSGAALAAEKVVQLKVPGCRPCGAAARISTIMKSIPGVIKYENKDQDLLLVTFDDKKTTVKAMISELEKGNFAVKSKPVYLK